MDLRAFQFILRGAAILAVIFVLVGAPAGAQERRSSAGFSDVDRLPQTPGPVSSGPFSSTPLSEFERRVRIVSTQPIRDADNVGYAGGRTTIEYNQYSLQADRMVIDYKSEDIQVEGNVIFRSPSEFIRAKAGRFNLTTGQGVAYGVEGQSTNFFFRVSEDYDEAGQGPAFRQVNETESVFKGMAVTTCDFPVPHYYVTASEVILLRKKRLYLRNPVLWVEGKPVMWLPFYTRDLESGSPWSNEFGWSSSLGGFFRLGYRYIHRVRTPRWDDPTKFIDRSHGQADLTLDLTTRRGEGVGALYRYRFDYKRHMGSLQVYGIRDQRREVENEELSSRWIYRHQHNSFVGDHLILQLDVDRTSDPDIYHDILDQFAADRGYKRGRLFEQRMRAAASWWQRDSVARVMGEQKRRLARDIYQDRSLPEANDLDFEPQPDSTDPRSERFDGISDNRYGIVTENGSVRWSTRLLNLGQAPLFYRFEANAFNALDPGLNTLDVSDDRRIYGFDLYAAITHRTRLGSRTTWTNTAGVGGVFYDRDQSEVISERDFNAGTIEAGGIRRVDGIRFRDRESFYLGNSDTISQTPNNQDSYDAFAEYTSRLNHRFSDFLDGYAMYQVRRSFQNNWGEYYERRGDTVAAGDIYDFYTDRHTAETGLNFYLRYPNLRSRIYGGSNLDQVSEIYANERREYAGFGTDYQNTTREFRASFNANYQERQIRDRRDPDNFEQGSIASYLTLAYFPRHARYWAQLTTTSNAKLDQDPVERARRDRNRFDENRPEVLITPTLGRRFGPKYRVQVSGTYETEIEAMREAGVTVIRDLHDAELGVFAGVRDNSLEARRRVSADNRGPRPTVYESDVRASIKFKLANDQPGLGDRSITTLSDLRTEAAFAE